MFTLKLKKHRIEISNDIIVVMIMLTFTFSYYWQSRGLSFQSLLFPRILFTGILITSVLSIKKCIKINKDVYHEDLNFDTEKNIKIIDLIKVNGKLVLFVVCVFSFICFLPELGSGLGIPLFLLIAMYTLNVRSKKILILVPVITGLFVYGVFGLWLEVPLPAGILGF